MYILGCNLLCSNTNQLRMSLYVLVGNCGRLLHNISQITCGCKHPFALAQAALHKENLTSNLSPGKTCNHSGHLIALLQVLEMHRKAQYALHILRSYAYTRHTVNRNPFGSVAGKFGNLPIQISYSRFPRVFVYYGLNGSLVNLKLETLEPVRLALLLNKVILGNEVFLLCKVTAYRNHLHSVLKGRGDIANVVGCCYEEHLGEVVIHIKVVVVEGSVLFWVKCFKKRRRGVSLVIGGHFINLVQHNYRVGRTALLYGVYYPSRHSANVGLSVAPYLRLVVHSSK